MRISEVDITTRSKLCHELLHVALGFDSFLEPDLSQDPAKLLCPCSARQWILVGSLVKNPCLELRLSNTREFLRDGECCTAILCSFNAGLSWLTIASPISPPSSRLRPCCSSSNASPSVGAGSCPRRSCRRLYHPCLRRRVCAITACKRHSWQEAARLLVQRIV